MVDYLRIGEVAQRVGVSVDTLRRWEADGRITFERRGNQRVLPAHELAGFLTSLSGSDKTSSARNRFTGVVVAWSVMASWPRSSSRAATTAWSR